MKLNDIKYLPKTNAFGDVYSKATGVPFIGELVAAAAGNGGQKESFTFTSIKVIKNGVDDYTIEATSNIPAPVDNTRVYLEDSLSQWGGSVSPIENGSTQWVLNPEYEYFFNEGSISTEGGECSAWGEFIEGNDHTIFGLNWTYEEPPVVESVTVTARQNSTSECQMYGMESCYTLSTVMTLNQNWVTSNCSGSLFYTLTIKDSSDNTIVETENSFWNCAESNVVEGSDYPEGSMPTFPESGNYVLSIYNIETPDIHIFDGTGTWTYQDPQI